MKNLINLLILLIPLQIYTQVQQEWVTRYTSSGSFYDEAYTIRLDNNSNVVVTGTINGYFGVCKYNNMGSLLWSNISSYSGGLMVRNRSLAIDNNNNIYIIATSNLNIITIKYDSLGTQQWINSYSTTGYSMDVSKRIEIDNQNYVYILGSISPNQYDFKYLLIKYNPINGDTVWTRIFDEGGGTGPFDMILDQKNNIYITGVSNGLKTIKYNSNGELKWVSASTNGESHAITTDKNGNVYVTGEEYGAYEMDCKTIKYDSNGVIQWIKVYNNYGVGHYDNAYSIATNDSSDVFIAGYSDDAAYMGHMLVVKYNTFGIQQWVRTYIGAGSYNDRASKIITDKNGDCYVTGYSNFSGPLHGQYTTIKYASNGTMLWIKQYRNLSSSNSDDFANDIVLDSSNNVYITGSSYGNNSYYDFATLKYSQNTIGINPINNVIPTNFGLSQNYPNPFNPVTNIKFSISYYSFVQLKIYDILGVQKDLVVNQMLQPSEYELKIDGSNYPSGVYFYQLSIDGIMFNTKKMIVIK